MDTTLASSGRNLSSLEDRLQGVNARLFSMEEALSNLRLRLIGTCVSPQVEPEFGSDHAALIESFHRLVDRQIETLDRLETIVLELQQV